MDEYLDILATISIPDNYDPRDRYNDFRQVFLETEQGRRVLKQILTWGHLLTVSTIANPVDPWRMVFAEGERNMALRLFGAMLKEPPMKSERQAHSPQG
jgi:hypothetical protein